MTDKGVMASATRIMDWSKHLVGLSRDPQFLKFCMVGVSNTLLSFLVFWTLVQGDLHVFLAQILSYLAGIFWSFFINSRWTFRANGALTNRFVRFLVLQVSLMLLSAFSVSTLTSVSLLGPSISWVLVMAVVTVVNFGVSRAFVFADEVSGKTAISGTTVLLACAILATAVFKGVSYGDSNHGTYLPAGIRLVDPTFLAGDWWVQNALHYHFAFKYLVAGLYSLNFLEWGVALLNIACVAGALVAVFSIIKKTKLHMATPALLIVFALISATDGLTSVANTYLFSQSLQPSTIGTIGLLWALSLFLGGRYGLTGLTLAASGLFHANFLLINIPVFGLMFAVQRFMAHGFQNLSWRQDFKPLLVLLMPSILVFLAALPVLGSLAFPDVAPAVQTAASRLFREFAVPHHYKPVTFLNQFWALAGWQLLGLIWTSRATSDQRSKQALYAIQIAFAAALWTATCLTTIVDFDFIARLFFWRLAPFSVLIALLIFLSGSLNELVNPAPTKRFQRQLLIGISLLALVAVARTNSHYFGLSDIAKNAPLFVALLILAASFARRYLAPPVNGGVANPNWLTAVAVAAMGYGMVIGINPINYKLLYMEGKYQSQFEAYKWIEKNTPQDALFLIPPEMGDFRLQTNRATVVDIIALPFGAKNLVDWYARLEVVSQTSSPNNKRQVIEGYRLLTSEQFADLQAEFEVDFALLHRSSWKPEMVAQTIYTNDRFVVLNLRRTVPPAH